MFCIKHGGKSVHRHHPCFKPTPSDQTYTHTHYKVAGGASTKAATRPRATCSSARAMAAVGGASTRAATRARWAPPTPARRTAEVAVASPPAAPPAPRVGRTFVFATGAGVGRWGGGEGGGAPPERDADEEERGERGEGGGREMAECGLVRGLVWVCVSAAPSAHECGRGSAGASSRGLIGAGRGKARGGTFASNRMARAVLSSAAKHANTPLMLPLSFAPHRTCALLPLFPPSAPPPSPPPLGRRFCAGRGATHAPLPPSASAFICLVTCPGPPPRPARPTTPSPVARLATANRRPPRFVFAGQQLVRTGPS